MRAQLTRGLRLRNVTNTRADLWKASSALAAWRTGSCYGPSPHVIRTFIGTKEGTFIKFPGGESARTYDPYVA